MDAIEEWVINRCELDISYYDRVQLSNLQNETDPGQINFAIFSVII